MKLSESLAEGMSAEHYTKWGRPGIRAQLINIKQRALVMDFLYEGDDRSFHVLNTISPGWTCSIPFSAFLVDRLEEQAKLA